MLLYSHTCVSVLLCRYAAEKQLMDVFTVMSQESVKYTQVDDGQMTCWYSISCKQIVGIANKRNNNRCRNNDAQLHFGG